MPLYSVPGLYISIHALREEGDAWQNATHGSVKAISIHALREEGDTLQKRCTKWTVKFLSTPSARRATPFLYFLPVRTSFLSTPSARRATENRRRYLATMKISIHALREEGDKEKVWEGKPHEYFYPRPPRGGRRQEMHRWQCSKTFLSTPSARRATHRFLVEE